MIAKYVIRKVMKAALKKKRVNTPTLESTTKQYKRMLERNKRPTPADTHVSAGTKGPIPLNKQSKIQSSLSGTEYTFPMNKYMKGIKFANDKTDTQRFQDNVRDLIGLDAGSTLVRRQLKKIFKNRKGKK